MTTPGSIAYRRHTLHVFDGGLYSHTYEPNLGLQDPNGNIDVNAGTTVHVSTGNVHHLIPVYWSDGVGIATNLDLHYNAQNTKPSLLTPGWSLFPLLTRHAAQGGVDTASVRYTDARTVTFTEVSEGLFHAP